MVDLDALADAVRKLRLADVDPFVAAVVVRFANAIEAWRKEREGRDDRSDGKEPERIPVQPLCSHNDLGREEISLPLFKDISARTICAYPMLRMAVPSAIRVWDNAHQLPDMDLTYDIWEYELKKKGVVEWVPVGLSRCGTCERVVERGYRMNVSWPVLVRKRSS